MKNDTSKSKTTRTKKVTRTASKPAVRTSISKKRTVRKSPASSKKTTYRSKGKVYIPRGKIVLMCLGIIAVCMILLLITNITDKSSKPTVESQIDLPSVIELPTETPAEPEVKKEVKPEPKKENNPVQKTTPISNDNEKSKELNNKQQKPSNSSEEKKPVKTEQKSTDQTKPINNPEKEKPKEPATSKKTDNISSTQTQQNTQMEFGFPRAVNHAQLVFLFDDGGQNLSQVDKFLNLPFPITVAVLPRLPYSKDVAEKVRKSGNELMLHQPMQALNESVVPGPGAIYPYITAEEVTSTLRYNINEIGPVAGVNNHEGSAITADAEKMEAVMKVISQQGVYFLDSRTNKDTKVPYVCQELGYSYYERNGNFLDNKKTRENALAELRKNLDIANKNGVVIMIGHIWSADFLPQLLADVYPELKAKGYTITTVSKSKGRK